MRLMQFNGVLYNMASIVSIRELDKEGSQAEMTPGFWERMPDPKSKTRRVEITANVVEVRFATGDKIRLKIDQAHVFRNVILDDVMGESDVINMDEYVD